MPKTVSKMSLAELQAERAALLPAIKKMKRNPAKYADELAKKSRRNLLLKDEILLRTKAMANEPLSMAA